MNRFNRFFKCGHQIQWIHALILSPCTSLQKFLRIARCSLWDMTGAQSYKRAICWLAWNSKGFFEAFSMRSFHPMLDLTFSNKHVDYLIKIKDSVWITILNYLANLWGSFGKRSFERKAMTNLDSILKNRDITLPIKICPVKIMIFPVVMYGCESWTIKKAEHCRTNAFELWC